MSLSVLLIFKLLIFKLKFSLFPGGGSNSGGKEEEEDDCSGGREDDEDDNNILDAEDLVAEEINRDVCRDPPGCSDAGGCSFPGVEPGAELWHIWPGCSVAGVSDQENELLLLLIEHGVASPGPGLGAGVHLGAGNGEDLS